MGHGPIEGAQRQMMNDLAEGLDKIFNGCATGKDKKIAFVLLTAKFGDIVEGRVNYISNGERDDMVSMLKELLARFEGAYEAPTTDRQQ